MSKKIWTFGVAFVDIIYSGLSELPQLGKEVFSKYFKISVGGGVITTAIGLAKLGAKSGAITKVGTDFMGKFIINELQYNGVLTDGVLVREENTPITSVISFKGERAFVSYVEKDKEDLSACNLKLLKVGDHIHIKSTNHLKTLIAFSKELGISTSVDMSWNTISDLGNISPFLKDIDIFFLNELEALCLCKADNIQAAANYLLSKGCKIIIIKRGKNGSLLFTLDKTIKADSLPVEPLDTTGAGDSFSAGFLFGFLNGLNLEESLIIANICGGLSVTALGGCTSSPTFLELQKSLKHYGYSFTLPKVR